MHEICLNCTAKDECDRNPTWPDGCAGFTNVPLNGEPERVIIDPKYYKAAEDNLKIMERAHKSLCYYLDRHEDRENDYGGREVVNMLFAALTRAGMLP